MVTKSIAPLSVKPSTKVWALLFLFSSLILQSPGAQVFPNPLSFPLQMKLWLRSHPSAESSYFKSHEILFQWSYAISFLCNYKQTEDMFPVPIMKFNFTFDKLLSQG
jgi:hypothetical protein